MGCDVFRRDTLRLHLAQPLDQHIGEAWLVPHRPEGGQLAPRHGLTEQRMDQPARGRITHFPHRTVCLSQDRATEIVELEQPHTHHIAQAPPKLLGGVPGRQKEADGCQVALRLSRAQQVISVIQRRIRGGGQIEGDCHSLCVAQEPTIPVRCPKKQPRPLENRDRGLTHLTFGTAVRQ